MKRFQFILISFLLVAVAARAQAPVTTTISDVVYRADGTPAGGTLLITWPAFESVSGKAVAAGSKSVTLGAGGVVNVALVPNEGATPSGTYYRVVYKLEDGSTSEELWSVPNVPPHHRSHPLDDSAVGGGHPGGVAAVRGHPALGGHGYELP